MQVATVALAAAAVAITVLDAVGARGPATDWESVGIDVDPEACPRAAHPIGSGGGIWVCDPLGIGVMLDECRAYILGHGNDFAPESGIHSLNWRCEIHSFDPGVSWAYNAPEYVRLHTAGLGPGHPPLEMWVRELGHAGKRISVLLADCGGCELRDLAREIQSCRSSAATNFTEVVAVVDLSVATPGAWRRGLADPMRAMGYTPFHEGPVPGRGWWVRSVSFVLDRGARAPRGGVPVAPS